MASMSPEKLVAFLKAQMDSQQAILIENASKTGPLKTLSTAQAFWNENFQNIEKVLNGQESVMDFYEANQQAIKALEKANQDALHGAKTAQKAGVDLSGTLTNAVTASANASGTKEAVQANTLAMATAAMGTIYGNNLLSDILATQAVKYEKENQEEARAIALQNQVADQAQQNVNSMKAALASQQTVGSSN
jgi:type IV secretion system protein TrbJ